MEGSGTFKRWSLVGDWVIAILVKVLILFLWSGFGPHQNRFVPSRIGFSKKRPLHKCLAVSAYRYFPFHFFDIILVMQVVDFQSLKL